MMSTDLCITLFVIIILYSVSILVYRLWLHPLSRFPGPKLAAATQWYEFYHDVVRLPGGQFMHEIDTMHDLYGPVVRINPNEIHIKDNSWQDVLFSNPTTVYSSGMNYLAGTDMRKGIRNKYSPAAKMNGTPDSVFGTLDHTIHRKRRAAVSPIFSKATINSFESMIHANTKILCDILVDQSSRLGFTELGVNYLAMTTDTLFEHAFHKSLGLLRNRQDAIDFHKSIVGLTNLAPVVRQFPWIVPLSQHIPESLLMWLNPDLARVTRLHKMMHEEAGNALRDCSTQQNKADRDSLGAKNVFKSILASPTLAKIDKTQHRLAQEGFMLTTAGGQTTAKVLTIATFFLAQGRNHILLRLDRDIREAFPNSSQASTLRQLESIPYLTAFIKESLRITSIITSRLPLVSPEEALQFGDWVIPSGTPISMSLRNLLFDPTIFENPHEFIPERWLPGAKNLECLNRAFVPFGRGSRNCLGINLAMAQLYIVIAFLVRHYDFELYETKRERDIDVVRDCFLGMPAPDTKGVRIQIQQSKC